MASIINASSTGSGGIVQTADASGVLQLQSNGTVVLTVNTSNQMVLGATGGSVSGSNSVGKQSIYKPIDATSVPYGTRMIDLYAYYPGFENANPSATVFAGVDASTSTQNGYVAFQTLNAGTLSEAFRVNQYGTAVLKGGSVNGGGVGICFPATAVTSTNANTLDDYEEGTWTPTSPVGLSVSTSSYIKIGNTVFINIFVNVNANSNATAFIIGSLPFPISAGSASAGSFNNDGGNYYAYMDSVGIYIRDSGNNSQTCAGLSGNFVAFQLNYPTTS
jgi:hypothetical protein